MVSTPQMCARLFYKNMDQTRPLFVYFRPFFVTMTNTVQQTINGKSIDGVLGIRTRGRSLVDADRSTELWRPPEGLRV